MFSVVLFPSGLFGSVKVIEGPLEKVHALFGHNP